MTNTLSRRLERLEGRFTPTKAPFEIEIEFISAVDGSVTKRLRLGDGANSSDRCRVGVRGTGTLPTLPGSDRKWMKTTLLPSEE